MLNIHLYYLMCHPLQIVPKPFDQQKEYQTDPKPSRRRERKTGNGKGLKKKKSSVQCKHTDITRQPGGKCCVYLPKKK